MIHADLDKILPEADALEKITSIIEEVETNQELFIITKSGRPAVAVINIDYLEELTGSQISTQGPRTTTEIKPDENPQDDEPILQEEEEAPASQIPSPYAQSPSLTPTPLPTSLPQSPAEPVAQTPPSAPLVSEIPQTPLTATPAVAQAPYSEAPSTPVPETSFQPTSTTTVSQSDDNLPPEDSNSGSPLG